MTYEYALKRLIEKLQERQARFPYVDDPCTEWSRGVASGTQWALEDAQMLLGLTEES